MCLGVISTRDIIIHPHYPFGRLGGQIEEVADGDFVALHLQTYVVGCDSASLVVEEVVFVESLCRHKVLRCLRTLALYLAHEPAFPSLGSRHRSLSGQRPVLLGREGVIQIVGVIPLGKLEA